jgi:hypothetical protein
VATWNDQPYFPAFSFENWRIRKSINGTPINIIQGTSEMVRINVRRYKGKSDNCCPKRKRNSVMEG